ncbi:hypothetical protein G6F68_019593 [Rhizopus microsporus]|nr:hypothetical protein G6F68_019593 [Rhizopus microsporus]
MSKVAADKKKPIIVVGAGAPALTNEQCTPYTLNYAYDTVAQARGTGAAVVKAGGKTWPPPPKSSRPMAAPCWAPRAIRWDPAISHPTCCRPRPAKPRSSGWRTRAATP